MQEENVKIDKEEREKYSRKLHIHSKISYIIMELRSKNLPK